MLYVIAFLVFLAVVFYLRHQNNKAIRKEIEFWNEL